MGFEKIIGYSSIKKELARLCDSIKNRKKYEELGITLSQGLLLDGEPGVGKTLMANCFIEESGLKAYTCRKDKSDGEFVNQIRNAFNLALENAPSIVFLDDMDKFANKDGFHRNAEEYITVQSCIDEVKNKGVFVLATTNSLGNLPDSLIRAGRFDTVIEVDVPRTDEATDIVKHYLSNKTHVEGINPEDIARLLSGHSCAELESVINLAGLYAGYNNKKAIEEEDIINACMRIIYRAPEGDSGYSPEVALRTAYHEAGHAVIAEILNPGCVNLLTIKNHYSDKAGFTSLSNPDDYWAYKSNMDNRVLTLLAGKAATEIVYGEEDMGVGSDIERAYRILYRYPMHGAYGFDAMIWDDRMASENLKTKQNDLIAHELNVFYAKTKQMLIENRPFLDELAHELAKKEVLTRSQIVKIKDKYQKEGVRV